MARAGVDQRHAPIEHLQTCWNVDPLDAIVFGGIFCIEDRRRYVNQHTADRIDESLEAAKIDLCDVVDRDAEELLDCFSCECAASRRWIGCCAIERSSVGVPVSIGSVDLCPTEVWDRRD